MSGIHVMHSDTQNAEQLLIPSACSPDVTFGLQHVIWGI